MTKTAIGNVAACTPEQAIENIRVAIGTGYEGLTNKQARFLLGELDSAKRKLNALMVERRQREDGLRP